MNEPNFRDQAVKLVQEHGYKDLCEVGVWRGALSEILAPLARVLVLVDPWSALWNTKFECTMGEPPIDQASLNRMYDHVRTVLPQALILRMPSLEAIRYVPYESLDFVFIDSVHAYHHCLLELNEWFKKLRDGGMLAGDDYCGDVKKAVDERFGPFYKDGIPNENNVWWVTK